MSRSLIFACAQAGRLTCPEALCTVTKEWVPKIRQLDAEASLTLVYMNNHWRGQAVGTARQSRSLLEKAEQ